MAFAGGDASSVAGRAGKPEPRVVRLELWTSGPQPKSWAPHGRRSRSATEELRRVRRSDRLSSRSDRQPLFRGWSDRLGSRSDHKQRPVVESLVERGAQVVVRA
jgi:hypothetical protein